MRNLSLWNDQNVNPWRGLFELQRNLERAFETDRRNEEAYFHPLCDVEEDDTHFALSVDLPGVAKKDINIEVHENQLYITGERKNETNRKNFSERTYGKFHRVMTLPSNVDATKIEANYEDGVLTIALPKSDAAKPRQIKVGEGKSSFFQKLVGSKEGTKKDEKPEATATRAA